MTEVKNVFQKTNALFRTQKRGRCQPGGPLTEGHARSLPSPVFSPTACHGSPRNPQRVGRPGVAVDGLRSTTARPDRRAMAPPPQLPQGRDENVGRRGPNRAGLARTSPSASARLIAPSGTRCGHLTPSHLGPQRIGARSSAASAASNLPPSLRPSSSKVVGHLKFRLQFRAFQLQGPKADSHRQARDLRPVAWVLGPRAGPRLSHTPAGNEARPSPADPWPSAGFFRRLNTGKGALAPAARSD